MKNFIKKNVSDEYSKIAVPKDKLDKALINAMDRGNKQTQKRIRNRIKVPILALGTACMMLVMGLFFTNSTLADLLKNLPIIESIFLNRGDKGLENVYENEKIQVINQTKENSDVKVTITEAYFDDTRFVVGYEINLLDKRMPVDQIFDFISNSKIYVNNKETNLSFGTSFSNQDVQSIKGILDFDPVLNKMGEEFDFTIEFEGTDDIKGDLTFEFPVYYVEGYNIPNSKVTLEDQSGEFSVSDVTVAPSGIKMDTKLSYPVRENQEKLPIQYFISAGDGLWFSTLEDNHIHESNEYFQVRFKSYYEKYRLEFPPVNSGRHFQVIPAIVEEDSKPVNYPIYKGAEVNTSFGSFTVTNIEYRKNELYIELLVNDENTFLSFENTWLLSSDDFISSLSSVEKIDDNLYAFQIETNEEHTDLSLDILPIEPLEKLKINYSTQ